MIIGNKYCNYSLLLWYSDTYKSMKNHKIHKHHRKGVLFAIFLFLLIVLGMVIFTLLKKIEMQEVTMILFFAVS